MFCGFAELQGAPGVKSPELQDAVCSKAMALCGIVTRYGAAPMPDGKPATIDAFLTRLIRQALHHSQAHATSIFFKSKAGAAVALLLVVHITEGMQEAEAAHYVLADRPSIPQVFPWHHG